MNSQVYFASIAEKKRELDSQFPEGFCLIVSVNNIDKNTTAGSRTEVSTHGAAKGIVDGTQRLMTADESKVWDVATQAQRVKIMADERRAIDLRVSMGGLMSPPAAPLVPPVKKA